MGTSVEKWKRDGQTPLENHNITTSQKRNSNLQRHRQTVSNRPNSTITDWTLLFKPVSSLVWHQRNPPNAHATTAASTQWSITCYTAPNYDDERDKLRKEVGIGGLWTEKLLGEPEFIEHTLGAFTLRV